MTYNKKLTLLKKRYKKELKRYSKYIITDIEKAKTIIKDLSEHIAKFDFKGFDLELTPSNAIKYDLQFHNNIVLFITRPFHKLTDVPEGNFVYSLFENHSIILTSYSDDIKNLVDVVNYYVTSISKKEIELGKTNRFRYNIYI